jgi:hypothetical protein
VKYNIGGSSQPTALTRVRHHFADTPGSGLELVWVIDLSSFATGLLEGKLIAFGAPDETLKPIKMQ